MDRNRLEAFSDGVFAIIITITVLQLKVPPGSDLAALRSVAPIFVTYILTFLYLGIYWNNHHHLLKACGRVNGAMLWANLHLLFWLSLLPFVTGWMGENAYARGTSIAELPSALYGAVLLMAAVAYYLLQSVIIAVHGRSSKLASAIGRDWKGKLSPAGYILAIAFSFLLPWVSACLYFCVAFVWLVPDRRIERFLGEVSRQMESGNNRG